MLSFSPKHSCCALARAQRNRKLFTAIDTVKLVSCLWEATGNMYKKKKKTTITLPLSPKENVNTCKSYP